VEPLAEGFEPTETGEAFVRSCCAKADEHIHVRLAGRVGPRRRAEYRQLLDADARSSSLMRAQHRQNLTFMHAQQLGASGDTDSRGSEPRPLNGCGPRGRISAPQMPALPAPDHVDMEFARDNLVPSA
jgi:hypothetical protein